MKVILPAIFFLPRLEKRYLLNMAPRPESHFETSESFLRTLAVMARREETNDSLFGCCFYQKGPNQLLRPTVFSLIHNLRLSSLAPLQLACCSLCGARSSATADGAALLRNFQKSDNAGADFLPNGRRTTRLQEPARLSAIFSLNRIFL